MNTVSIAQITSRILLELGCIILRPTKPFTYNTGIISPVYTDNRLILSTTKERKKITSFLIKKIKIIGVPQVIAGTATAGIPYASFIADHLNIPLIYVRPKAKEYGRKNKIEGSLKKGQSVIVVDDLISTAKSSLDVVDAIRDSGGKASHIIAITTYELEISQHNLKKKKIKLHALTNLETTADIAVKRGFLKKDKVEIVLDWVKNPHEWAKKNGFK